LTNGVLNILINLLTFVIFTFKNRKDAFYEPLRLIVWATKRITWRLLSLNYIAIIFIYEKE